MAVVKALSFMSYNTVVLATQIHDTIFNTIHHCVTEDRHKSWELPFPCTPLAITHSLDHDFLPRDAMHSADYAVARCPSVCLFVCSSHAGILSKRLNISSNFFHHRVATTF